MSLREDIRVSIETGTPPVWHPRPPRPEVNVA